MSRPLPDPQPAGLRRSVQLLSAFRLEQSDPAYFYGLLARDSVAQIERHMTLSGATMLDVGGGPGFFANAFRDAGATYFTVDADAGELSAHSVPGPGTVLGSALSLPIRSACLDLSFSSNVLEHVPDPWQMASEMVRVVQPGGLIFLSYTSWWSPWGGHETSPWHYLGGRRAARRYERRHGGPPKNVFGESLFPVSVSAGLRWARRCSEVEVIAAMPRYHPSWATWIVRVPGLREVFTWNLLLVLRRR